MNSKYTGIEVEGLLSKIENSGYCTSLNLMDITDGSLLTQAQYDEILKILSVWEAGYAVLIDNWGGDYYYYDTLNISCDVDKEEVSFIVSYRHRLYRYFVGVGVGDRWKVKGVDREPNMSIDVRVSKVGEHRIQVRIHEKIDNGFIVLLRKKKRGTVFGATDYVKNDYIIPGLSFNMINADSDNYAKFQAYTMSVADLDVGQWYDFHSFCAELRSARGNNPNHFKFRGCTNSRNLQVVTNNSEFTRMTTRLDIAIQYIQFNDKYLNNIKESDGRIPKRILNAGEMRKLNAYLRYNRGSLLTSARLEFQIK